MTRKIIEAIKAGQIKGEDFETVVPTNVRRPARSSRALVSDCVPLSPSPPVRGRPQDLAAALRRHVQAGQARHQARVDARLVEPLSVMSSILLACPLSSIPGFDPLLCADFASGSQVVEAVCGKDDRLERSARVALSGSRQSQFARRAVDGAKKHRPVAGQMPPPPLSAAVSPTSAPDGDAPPPAPSDDLLDPTLDGALVALGQRDPERAPERLELVLDPVGRDDDRVAAGAGGVNEPDAGDLGVERRRARVRTAEPRRLSAGGAHTLSALMCDSPSSSFHSQLHSPVWPSGGG